MPPNDHAMSTPETLGQWALRVAPLLDGDAWAGVHRGEETASFLEVNAKHPVRADFPEMFAALLAYGAKVADGLVECERDVLCGRGKWGAPASLAAAEALRGRGLHAYRRDGVDLISEPTDLGREISRVLAARLAIAYAGSRGEQMGYESASRATPLIKEGAPTAARAVDYWWSYLSPRARAALTRHDRAGLLSTIEQFFSSTTIDDRSNPTVLTGYAGTLEPCGAGGRLWVHLDDGTGAEPTAASPTLEVHGLSKDDRRKVYCNRVRIILQPLDGPPGPGPRPLRVPPVAAWYHALSTLARHGLLTDVERAAEVLSVPSPKGPMTASPTLDEARESQMMGPEFMVGARGLLLMMGMDPEDHRNGMVAERLRDMFELGKRQLPESTPKDPATDQVLDSALLACQRAEIDGFGSSDHHAAHKTWRQAWIRWTDVHGQDETR